MLSCLAGCSMSFTRLLLQRFYKYSRSIFSRQLHLTLVLKSVLCSLKCIQEQTLNTSATHVCVHRFMHFKSPSNLNELQKDYCQASGL